MREALARVDYRKLVLDPEKRTAFLAEAGMRIGLGAIAKGYAVDRAIEWLERDGFKNLSVNAGGDLAVRGKKNGELWWIGIRDPRREDDFAAVLPVSNASVVTSGDYERFFMHDGKRYCHIIDTRTGFPASSCQSVTILAKPTYFADAFATAVFVLGPERGIALVESLPGVEAMIIDADGRTHLSQGLAENESP